MSMALERVMSSSFGSHLVAVWQTLLEIREGIESGLAGMAIMLTKPGDQWLEAVRFLLCRSGRSC